jgi:hypothetical protein
MFLKFLFIFFLIVIHPQLAFAGAAVQRARHIEQQQEAYKEAVRQQMIQQRQQQEMQAYQQAVEQKRASIQQAYRQAYQEAVQNQVRQQQQAYVDRYEDALTAKANQERQAYQQALQQKAYQQATYQRSAYEQAALQAQAQQAYHIAAQRQVVQQQAIAYGGTLHVNNQYYEIPEEPQDVADINQIIAELDITSEIWPLIMDIEPKMMIIEHYIKRFAKQGVVIRKDPAAYVQMIDSMILGNAEMLKTPFENILKVSAIAEYDFDNGQDKDRMARQVLGETVYQENRKRLGR